MLRYGLVMVMLLSVYGVGLSAPGDSAPRTPRVGQTQMAEKYYKEGLLHRDAAWVYEEKMAGTVEEKDRAPYAKFIQNTYKRAVAAFEKAVEEDPKFYQAYSSLGYARRKAGDLEAALAAYDLALSLNPTYSEAVEYRAEAYFELGRIEAAQKAYLILEKLNKPYASRLLAFAEKWVAGQESEETRVAVLTWVNKKRETLGDVKEQIEKW
ncbi:MAG: tetratricopeptide (TPR) repeat protein [Candidatus Latescibacterota bacterium]|jgi:tetratricopeptide (TPR) repeat protein